jgi:hypothetical protein
MPITTRVVISNSSQGEVYSIQHYVKRFVNDLHLVGCFFRGTPVYSTNTTVRHDITEILLNTINQTKHFLFYIYMVPFCLSPLLCMFPVYKQRRSLLILHHRVAAGFYYTKVKWPNSYKFLRPFVLKGTYSIGQLCPNLSKTYRSFNDIIILRCGLILLMQLELNLIFICFKLAYLLWYLELTTRQVFRGHHLFPKKS